MYQHRYGHAAHASGSCCPALWQKRCSAFISSRCELWEWNLLRQQYLLQRYVQPHFLIYLISYDSLFRWHVVLSAGKCCLLWWWRSLLPQRLCLQQHAWRVIKYSILSHCLKSAFSCSKATHFAFKKIANKLTRVSDFNPGTIYCPDHTVCYDNQTCCHLKSGRFGCCPDPQVSFNFHYFFF